MENSGENSMVPPERVFAGRTWVQIRQFLGQALRFGMVGILNTALTLSVIYVLYVFFHANYYIANGIGYVIGFTNSFLWNKFWTFKSSGHPVIEFALFISIFGVAYGVQVLWLWLLMSVAGLSIVVSQGFAMCAYTATSFLGNRFVTFRKGMKHA